MQMGDKEFDVNDKELKKGEKKDAALEEKIRNMR